LLKVCSNPAKTSSFSRRNAKETERSTLRTSYAFQIISDHAGFGAYDRRCIGASLAASFFNTRRTRLDGKR